MMNSSSGTSTLHTWKGSTTSGSPRKKIAKKSPKNNKDISVKKRSQSETPDIAKLYNESFGYKVRVQKSIANEGTGTL